MKYSFLLQLVFISLLVFSQQKLMTSKMFENLRKTGQIPIEFTSDNIKIPESTCNVVDVTPILPPGKQASEFITRSGFLKVPRKQNSALGFIFWGAMAAKGDVDQLKNYPALIWLQGGPGYSSQMGAFTEMGPILATSFYDGRDTQFFYRYNEYTWAKNYNMIFIDQPLGTGLSHVDREEDIPTDQDEASVDFYQALEQLYTSDTGCFNILGIQKNPLFITGESYAGKFVPSFTSYILAQKSSSVVKQALLKGGSAAGNGFTDPVTIMQVLPTYAYNLALYDKVWRGYAQIQADQGVISYEKGDMQMTSFHFDQVLGWIPDASGVQDPYNWANIRDEYPDDLSLTAFLNWEPIKTGVFKFPKELQFRLSSSAVSIAYEEDFMKPNVVKTVEHILEQDFPLMFYNGQLDIICCAPCTVAWLDKLYYPGQPEFKNKKYSVWNTFDSQTRGGYFKQSKSLVFSTVNQAGHFVPSDQPEAAYTLITSFVDWALARQKHNDSQQFDAENQIFNLKSKEQEQMKIE